MNMFAISVFAGEIVFHIKIVERSANKLLNDMDNLDSVDIWSNVQQILVSSSNISKVLWPPNKRNKKRGKELRSLLHVSEDSPLNNRSLRNHFEHFDEHIDNWVKHSSQGLYKDLEIMFPVPKWAWMGPPFNRAYDPVNHIVMFRDESLELQSIFESLRRLKDKCSKYAIV